MALLFKPSSIPVLNSRYGVAPGAKAYFYLSGTNTPTPVYTSADLGTEHANPVIANPYGILPAIYLDPAIVYRCVLTTAEGVQVDDIDPYIGDSGDTIFARNFGATGDGTTDDTQSLTTALSAASGETLVLGRGTFSIDAINLPSSIRIKGAGPGATTIKLRASNNDDVLTSVSGVAVILEDLTIDGNKSANGSPAINSGNGLSCTSTALTILNNVEFKNCKGNGAMWFGGSNIYAANCRFNSNDANGTYLTTTAVLVDDGPGIAHFVNCHASGNYYDGFDVDPGAYDVTYASCTATTNTGVGFNVYGNTSGVYPRRVTHSSCIARGNTLEGFTAHGCTDVIYNGCISEANGLASGRNNGIIVQNDGIGQVTLRRVVISNCIIRGSGGHGIYVDKVAGANSIASVVIDGNLIEDVSEYAAGYAGIHVANAAYVSMTGNHIRDSRGTMRMDYAVEFGSSVTNVSLNGGMLIAGTAGLIGGTPTNYAYDYFDGTNRQVSTDGYIAFGSDNFAVTSAGALGLGTPTPTAALDMFRSGTTTVDRVIRNGTVAMKEYVDSGAGYFGTTTAHDLILLANNATRGRLYNLTGSGESALALVVNDGAVTSLRRVVVGAADSAGTGFRTLRVAN